jgi:hypothetical protein
MCAKVCEEDIWSKGRNPKCLLQREKKNQKAAHDMIIMS